MTAHPARRRCRVLVLTMAVGLFVASSLAHRATHAAKSAAAGTTITVHLDRAKILKLPEETATLVVGNPLIADITVQQGGILVVTGKSYGITNLVALDRSGTTLMEHPIEVQGPRDKIVVVYRGIERKSYSCTPGCERRITLGDTPAYVKDNLSLFNTLNNLAQGEKR